MLWPPAPRKEGGNRQLYFGEVVTLWGLSFLLLRWSPGPGQSPRGPGRTWSGRARRARTGGRAACSPRGIDIGVTQRVSFPHGLSGVGAGWPPLQTPINFPAPASGERGAASPHPTFSPNTPLSGAGEGAGGGGPAPPPRGAAAAADRSPDERLAPGPRRARRCPRHHLPARVPPPHPPPHRQAAAPHPSGPGAWAPTCRGPCPGAGEGAVQGRG